MKKLHLIVALLVVSASSLFISCDDDELKKEEALYVVNIHPCEEFSNQLYLFVKDGTGKTEQPASYTYDPQSDTTFHISSWNESTQLGISTVWTGALFYVDAGETSQVLDSFLEEKTKNFKSIDYLGTIDYIYAGIRDGATITADKPLFGQQSGSDLSDYFTVCVQHSQVFAATYPDFHITHDYRKESLSVPFSEFFSKGTTLSYVPYYLKFNALPEESYDELRFTVTLPIECEYFQQLIHGRNYAAKYYEQGLVVPNENRVLRGSITICFD